MEELRKRIKIDAENTKYGILDISDYIEILNRDYENSDHKQKIDKIYGLIFTDKASVPLIKFTIDQIDSWESYDPQNLIFCGIDNNIAFVSAMNTIFKNLVCEFKMKFNEDKTSCTFAYEKNKKYSDL